MAHISLPEGLPGIRGPMAFRPETAKPLSELAQVLLHDAHSLTRGERELIATYVSTLNNCFYCRTSHGAIAAHHLNGDEKLVQQVMNDFRSAPISEKLKTLLQIAENVQRGGQQVTEENIAAARQQGATDLEIHDTVLIAAAFCLYNRYVDGLATWAPADQDSYRARGADVGEYGYMKFPNSLKAANGTR
jgi:uncharacterized peroxidase-related enzyme